MKRIYFILFVGAFLLTQKADAQFNLSGSAIENRAAVINKNSASTIQSVVDTMLPPPMMERLEAPGTNSKYAVRCLQAADQCVEAGGFSGPVDSCKKYF